MTFTDVPIDDVRSWWNRRPCNIAHSTQPIGTRAYFDEVEAKKYRSEPHIPGFAEFRRWAGRDVLEIGCGLGTDTINFARAGARVVATDVSDRSLELAEQRASVCGVSSHIDFLRVDAEEFTLMGRYVWEFDLVYAFGVIHHSPHPERILDQAAQLLKPDGELRVMIYHRHATKVAALVVRHPLRALRGIDRAVALQSEAQSGCPITYTYSRRQARELVERAGFRVVDLRVDHIFPYAVGPYRRNQWVKRWYWSLVPRPLFRAIERRFGWHLLLTCRLA